MKIPEWAEPIAWTATAGIVCLIVEAVRPTTLQDIVSPLPFAAKVVGTTAALAGLAAVLAFLGAIAVTLVQKREFWPALIEGYGFALVGVTAVLYLLPRFM